MFDSFKKLGNGLIETVKNTADLTKGKTNLVKSYYKLGELVVSEYKNGNLKLDGEIKIKTDELIKLSEDVDNVNLLDENVMDSISEIKTELNKSKTETKTEEAKTEVKPKKEVKKTTAKKTTAKKATDK
jgi:hypothetical protein